MRHFILLATTLFFFASCNNTSKQPNAQSIPQREGIQWGTVQLGERNDFNESEEFTITFTYADGTIDSMLCYLPYPMTMEDVERMEIGRVTEDDINFDGIPDVQFFLGYENIYGNDTYEAFVWNKEKGGFENVEVFSGIYAPEIVQDSQYILGTHREWLEGVEYLDFQKYQWIDKVLTLVDSWHEEIDTNEEESSNY